MAKRSMFVGLDVHKESIDISLAEEGRQGEVRHYGVIAGDLEALAKVVRALRAPDRGLRLVYEAGPCGFGIHRYLTAQGEDCVVVNPSSMPKRSGDRIKTDRRDGDALARLHRAGELTAIYIPTPDDEALRDLVRAREDAVGLSTQAKHRLKAFLLRQGRRYPGRAGWTMPVSTLAGRSELPARAAAHRAAGVPRHDRRNGTPRRAPHRPTSAPHPGVALGAGRRTRCRRCAGSRLSRPSASSRRSATSDDSSIRVSSWRCSAWSRRNTRVGPSVRRGGITKAGNPHARRLLAEAAWAYQGVPRIGRQMLYRQEALPKSICDIAWKAQLRLTSRFRSWWRAEKRNRKWPRPSPGS